MVTTLRDEMEQRRSSVLEMLNCLQVHCPMEEVKLPPGKEFSSFFWFISMDSHMKFVL
jgi:hypothetical protein